VVFTTTRFQDLTARVAQNFGADDVRVVVVDHPLGGTPEATIEQWGGAAVERLIQLLS
jgi:hypothetical protein